MTKDPDGAKAFYTAVVGWTAGPADIGNFDYTVLSRGEVGLAGVLAGRPGIDMNEIGAFWTGYIYVEDVDATAKRIIAEGGSIVRPAWDVPEVGRMLVAADPLGAKFMIMRPTPVGTPGKPDPHAIGHVGWHELHVSDAERAFAFYSTLFGWTKGEAVDMGPMGIYQLFQVDGQDNGGMMNNTLEAQNGQEAHPYWMFYFTVDSINAAADRVKQNGGSITHGPIEVPGGSWVVMCRDPQGGHFSLTADK
jgi:predicted enzyme related to lactoylglutathione lyase